MLQLDACQARDFSISSLLVTLTWQQAHVLQRKWGDTFFHHFCNFLWPSLVLGTRKAYGLSGSEQHTTHTHKHTADPYRSVCWCRARWGVSLHLNSSLNWLLFRTRLAHFNPSFPLKPSVHTLHDSVQRVVSHTHTHTQSKSRLQIKQNHTHLKHRQSIKNVQKVNKQCHKNIYCGNVCVCLNDAMKNLT